MNKAVLAELAPTGTLRAGINMSNFLLVTGKTPTATPTACRRTWRARSPGASACRSSWCPSPRPTGWSPPPRDDVWDIGMVGAEPQREKMMAFTAAYAEIEATYLVRKDSPLKACSDVDKKGVSIITRGGSAYGLWLERNIKNATLILTKTADEAKARFISEKIDAFAGLRDGARQGRPEESRDAHPAGPVRRRAAGRRHAQEERGRHRLPARGRRGGEGVRADRELHREAQGERPVGRPPPAEAASSGDQSAPGAMVAGLPSSYSMAEAPATEASGARKAVPLSAPSTGRMSVPSTGPSHPGRRSAGRMVAGSPSSYSIRPVRGADSRADIMRDAGERIAVEARAIAGERA